MEAGPTEVRLQRNIRGFIDLAAPYDFALDKPDLPRVFAGLNYCESQPSRLVDGGEPHIYTGVDDVAVLAVLSIPYRSREDEMTVDTL
jgi:hypothetical protein